MIYFIKSLYSFLFPPGFFILLLLAVGLWLYLRVRRSAGMVLFASALLLYIMTIPLVGESMLRSLEGRYEPPAVIDGDVYVLLTGGAVAGTPDIGATGHLSGPTLHRVVAAAQLYARNPLPILVSGGQVYKDTANEGQLSKAKLIALGVPEQDIHLDDASRTTQENARNTKQLLEKEGLKRPVLVTSAFHMPRSVMHFNKVGISVQPYPVDYKVSRVPDAGLSGRLFVPSASDSVSMTLKELLGMLQ